MGIVPRYEIPQSDFPVPVYPVMPADTTVPALLKDVAQIGLGVSAGLAATAAKQRHLADVTELAKRTVMAENGIDSALEAIRTNIDRTTLLTAPETYLAKINNLSQTWSKGLNDNTAAVLARHLPPRPAARA